MMDVKEYHCACATGRSPTQQPGTLRDILLGGNRAKI